MKILITGGAGFIGTKTAKALLKQGHDVRVLDILDPQVHGPAGGKFPGSLPKEVEKLRGDVRNLQDVKRALDGVSAVYHFAALTGVGQSMYEIQSYVDTNDTGTATLFQAILESRRAFDRIILSSSRAVYGEGTAECPTCGVVFPQERSRANLEKGDFLPQCPKCYSPLKAIPTGEVRPLFPVSVYGWTKKHQEDIALHSAKAYGLPVVVLRYFNVYGEGQSLINPYTGVLPIFFSRIAAGKPISLYERGMPLRDFVHVSDVVRANLLALERKILPGTTINVGSGKALSIKDIILVLAREMGTQPHWEDRGEYRMGDIFSCYADTQNGRETLAFKADVAFDAGIREFITWAKNQGSSDLYETSVAALKKRGLFKGAT